MSERLTDDELETFPPLMLELAEVISPPIAERLSFGLERGAIVRELSIGLRDGSELDLVALARLVRKLLFDARAAGVAEAIDLLGEEEPEA